MEKKKKHSEKKKQHEDKHHSEHIDSQDEIEIF